MPAAQADDEVIDSSMTLQAISACMAQDVDAVVEWAKSLSPAGKTRVCPARAANVRVGNVSSAMGSGAGMRWSS